MGEIRFEWLVAEEAVPAAVTALEGAGGRLLGQPAPYEPSEEDLEDLADPAFDPITVVAVALSLGALARVISDIVLAHQHPGGDLFDLRDGKLRHWVVPRLERGTLVIVTKTGIRRFPPAKRADGLAVLDQALGGLSDG